MQIVLCIIGALFGGLSLLASLTQIKQDKKSSPAILMAAGSVLLIAAVIFNIFARRFDVIAALFGCIVICAAAIQNGINSGKLHLSHHIVRILLSLALVLGFYAW